MKTFRKEFKIITERKEQALAITEKVSEALCESGISEGFCIVNSLHTSSSVIITDSDISLNDDMSGILAGIVPCKKKYLHDENDSKRNATAHLKAMVMGLGVTIPVSAARLDLGRYQTIYYLEYDGMRQKAFFVKCIGE
ncbi:MAG: secondary thiamine-phosphate synthase enzyme YjbQ [bacterium]|nr:secondary thiamine-phosphate synthase enzyme YjbQ [bacterium]